MAIQVTNMKKFFYLNGGQFFCFPGTLKILGREKTHREILMENKRRWYFLEHLLLAPDDTRKGDTDEISTRAVTTQLTIYLVWFEINLIVPSSLGTQSKPHTIFAFTYVKYKGNRNPKRLKNVKRSTFKPNNIYLQNH